MKRLYIQPCSNKLRLNSEGMIAASIDIDNNVTIDSEDEYLAGKKGWSSDAWSDGDTYWNDGDSED